MSTPQKKPKPKRDLHAEFLMAGMGEGFSQAQLEFLWKATEQRPRPTRKLDANDYAGLTGMVLIVTGIALWSVPGSLVLAGILIVAAAYLTAK